MCKASVNGVVSQMQDWSRFKTVGESEGAHIYAHFEDLTVKREKEIH